MPTFVSTVFLIVIFATASPLFASPTPSFAHFGLGKEAMIRDLAVAHDGDLLATGILSEVGEAPVGTAVRRLLEGDHQSGLRGFVLKMRADLSTCEWLALWPAGTLQPNRMAVADDGSIVVGGKHLGGFAELDARDQNWKGRDGVLAKLSADGKRCEWFSPSGPNQGEITGLDIDKEGRVFFTAGSKQRQAANYILRKDLETGENVPWADDAWCVYLHTNQKPLKQEGQFLSYYAKAREQSEGGFGYDYDGEDGGWGPVAFSLKGFRIGGQVLVLPDGDIAVSSCLQYDFRVNPREDGKIKKGKSFPAFDYFLARYSPDGELRWSTNLYQPGDSVHTPDQKPIDLAHDPKTDRIYALVKQHGSNVYRFKGDLIGDTGNLMISWLGQIDARNGELREGWYFQNNRTGRFGEDGLPQSPPYPKLAGNALQQVAIDEQGKLLLTGSGGAKTWTSANAFQSWPTDQHGGNHGVLLRLKPDLRTVEFATCLFVDAQARFHPQAILAWHDRVILAGRGSASGELAGRFTPLPWSLPAGEAGCLLVSIPNSD